MSGYWTSSNLTSSGPCADESDKCPLLFPPTVSPCRLVRSSAMCGTAVHSNVKSLTLTAPCTLLQIQHFYSKSFYVTNHDQLRPTTGLLVTCKTCDCDLRTPFDSFDSSLSSSPPLLSSSSSRPITCEVPTSKLAQAACELHVFPARISMTFDAVAAYSELHYAARLRLISTP